MKTVPNPRAFPIETDSEVHYGISLLDYFAAKAMQGLLTGSANRIPDRNVIAYASYDIAEAMLAEREKRN